MWFSLFATVLILAITFYQGLQGLFTALINCILTVLSVSLAFGLYENVYAAFLVDKQLDYGRPVALMGIFIVSLLLLRVLFDKWITGNMHFHVYVDRCGGGLFGLVTAMIVVGMLTISFQMLPFETTFLGFSRYVTVDQDSNQPVTGAVADWSKVKQIRQSIWLNSGGFTTSLVSHLSDNVLRGRPDTSFGEVYPDYLAYIYRAKANPLGPSRITVEPDALKVVAYWDLYPNEFYVREHRKSGDGKPIIQLKAASVPEAGSKRWAVRVSIDEKARDTDNLHRFTSDQFRLFAREKPGGPYKIYVPVGLGENPAVSSPGARGRLVEVYPGEGFSRESNGPLQLDLVFLVPENPEFKPVFIEYKVNARAEISPSQDKKKNHPQALNGAKEKAGAVSNDDSGSAEPRDASTPQAHPTFSPKKSNTGSNKPEAYGQVAGLGPADAVSLSDGLPWPTPLTRYNGEGEISNGVIRGTHDITADLDANWKPLAGTQKPFDRFEVPEGMRLLQVSVEKLHAGSTYGQALAFAVESLGDFHLDAEGGKQFHPVGRYAMAQAGGRNLFELIYLDKDERDMARLPAFTRIKGSDLKDDYTLVYLFHVPPGTKPAEVHTGRRPVDLREFKIVVK